jgi:hypothetical protein
MRGLSWNSATMTNGARYPFQIAERTANEVLKELAAYFTRLTGDRFAWTAVRQQVDWGKTRQKEIRDGHLRQFILNKAAAVEMGFLSPSSLPATVFTEMGRRPEAESAPQGQTDDSQD